METDLAHHNPFTTALRSLGRTASAKEAGRKVSLFFFLFAKDLFLFSSFKSVSFPWIIPYDKVISFEVIILMQRSHVSMQSQL